MQLPDPDPNTSRRPSRSPLASLPKSRTGGAALKRSPHIKRRDPSGGALRTSCYSLFDGDVNSSMDEHSNFTHTTSSKLNNREWEDLAASSLVGSATRPMYPSPRPALLHPLSSSSPPLQPSISLHSETGSNLEPDYAPETLETIDQAIEDCLSFVLMDGEVDPNSTASRILLSPGKSVSGSTISESRTLVELDDVESSGDEKRQVDEADLSVVRPLSARSMDSTEGSPRYSRVQEGVPTCPEINIPVTKSSPSDETNSRSYARIVGGLWLRRPLVTA